MLVNINFTDFVHCISNERSCNDSEDCSESSTVFAVRNQDEVEENLCYSHKKVSIHAMVFLLVMEKKNFPLLSGIILFWNNLDFQDSNCNIGYFLVS